MVNGKRYIGSSTNLYERGLKHRSLLRHNKHHNVVLQNSFNKYGEKNFLFYLITFCNKGELIEQEQFYIDKLSPSYNLKLEVVRNILTEESRAKISATLKRRYAEGYSNSSERKVATYTKEGSLVQVYTSITKCAKDIGADYSNVKRALNGRQKSCKSFIVKYFNP